VQCFVLHRVSRERMILTDRVCAREPVGEVANGSGGAISVALISTYSASTYGLSRLPSGTAIPAARVCPCIVFAGRSGSQQVRTPA
jgi:hypothetical protein